MCETTPDEEWQRVQLLNLHRFPWIDDTAPRYGVLESCPECTDMRISLVEPRSMSVVDGRTEDSSGSADIGSAEENGGSESWYEGSEGGQDMDRPV